MWADIPGWAGRYEVSTTGLVRSKDMLVPAAGGGTALRKGRELTLVLKGGRYMCVTLTAPGGVRKQCFIHDLVLLAFEGPKPEGQLVRHLNGNCRDNRKGNLKYGTHMENMQDKAAHGSAKGHKHPQARLTAAQVRYIRASPATGKALARVFSVSESAVSSVRTRVAWSHLLV